MGRSALKKKGNNLNDPLSTKLYKKQSNYADNLSQKVKKDFRNICHMDHPPKRLFSEIYATWTILQKDYFQKYMPHGPSSKKTIFRNICHMDHPPKRLFSEIYAKWTILQKLLEILQIFLD